MSPIDTGYCWFVTRGVLDTLPARFCPDATTKPKGLKWEYQCAPANGGIASLLQSARLVAAVAELGSFGVWSQFGQCHLSPVVIVALTRSIAAPTCMTCSYVMLRDVVSRSSPSLSS